MLTEHEAREALQAGLVGTASLVDIQYIVASAERLDGELDGDAELADPAITVQYQEVDGRLAYKLDVSVDRPDIGAQVSVVVQYIVEDIDQWRDESIVQVFGSRVAVLAAWPFARVKLREITSDMGTSPVSLGLMVPSGDGDSDRIDARNPTQSSTNTDLAVEPPSA